MGEPFNPPRLVGRGGQPLVRPPKPPRDYCFGKVRHPSRGMAAAHLRALLRRYPEKVEEGLTVYDRPCGRCRGWHIGHLRRPA